MATLTVLDPVFTDSEADAIVEIWHRHPAYHTSGTGRSKKDRVDLAPPFPRRRRPGGADLAVEAAPAPPVGPGARHLQGFASELGQRADQAINIARTRGDRLGPRGRKGARIGYFRESYAYSDEVFAPGIELLLDHAGLAEAARHVHDRPVIVPNIVYANILIPGQDLAIHTDVPEFRGVNRKVAPLWLLVVMHHSRLFEPWRMRVATAVNYVGRASGGGFVYYPDGPDGPLLEVVPHHNMAVVLDADSVLHGVAEVDGDDSFADALPPTRSKLRLVHAGDHRWALSMVGDPDRKVVTTLGSDELRFSVSWKAYCFADEAEHRAWWQHEDDLPPALVLERLVAELSCRGRLPGPDHGLDDADLGRLMIDEFLDFPAAVVPSP